MSRSSNLAIDALNLRIGGGLTHLIELLGHAYPEQSGINEVHVWGGESLNKVAVRPWLKKHYVKESDRSYFERISWASRNLSHAARQAGCSLLFSPSGTFAGGKVPVVSMSQNMLLFDHEERQRFPWGWNRLRYNLLRKLQIRSFLRAAGILFISQYAKQRILQQYPNLTHKPNRVIYHGVNDRFDVGERRTASRNGAFRLLYVSRVNYYKHQWNVIRAVNQINNLNSESAPLVQLRLVGQVPAELRGVIDDAVADSAKGSIVECGEVPYNLMESEYRDADGFIFASTCENMPNILLEAMSAGLPIACSHYGPMPEIVGDSGLYFDPLSIDDTVNVIRQLIYDDQKRFEIAGLARARSKMYSWEQTARESFAFFSELMPSVRASDSAGKLPGEQSD